MEQREIERAIGELEERVDRLRALYEQYFLGYEKLEPTVPRKDVDRRFAILRKENMRNTAIRFRFNVVTQKYNTYAMHWTRICRQIEEGTYKRHVRRAKERFGDAAPGRERERALAEPSFDVELDFAELDGADVDALLKEADGAASPPSPPPPPAPAPVRPPAPPAAAPDRVARPAAMPTGARPMLIRKVVKAPDPGGAPAPGADASSGHVPAAPVAPAAPSSTRALPSAPRTGVPAAGAPARPMIRPVRPPSPSAPDLGPSSRPRLPLPSQIGRKRDEKE